MRMRRIASLAAATVSLTALAAYSATAQAKDLTVVASIPPLAGIAASVLDGIAKPQTLIRDGGSPHAYSLRPSDAKALADADVVLWVGPGLESFLDDKLDTLAPKAERVTAMELPGMELLPYRTPHHHDEEGEEEEHEEHEHHDEVHDEHEHADHDEDHDGDHHDEDHAEDYDGDHDEHAGHHHGDGPDSHVWLDPQNARLIAKGLADAVRGHLASEQQVRLDANLRGFDVTLDALTVDMAALLSPVKNRPYLTFHDAYQYFDRHFGLDFHGAVTVSPEVQPGAASLQKLREEVEEHHIACIFAEPQFEPRAIKVLSENLPVQVGTLDPLGGMRNAEPGGYAALMLALAQSYRDCLLAK
jgi:zinc transport system substrate-binding protein